MIRLPATPLALALALALPTLTSCVGSAEMHTEGAVTTTTPRLVWIAPGLWVLEDHAYPMFFYGDYYWMLRDGTWYRADYYNTAFVRVTVVPSVLLDIRTPRRYVHYRAPRDARVRVLDRQPPKVRDHRAKPQPRQRDHRRKR